jgi:hypothetical protein
MLKLMQKGSTRMEPRRSLVFKTRNQERDIIIKGKETCQNSNVLVSIHLVTIKVGVLNYKIRGKESIMLPQLMQMMKNLQRKSRKIMQISLISPH